jgi:Ca-activated chloride channel homolog
MWIAAIRTPQSALRTPRIAECGIRIADERIAMSMSSRLVLACSALVAGAVVVTGAQSQEGFRFKSGVELINVTATVTDENGRFVSGLRQGDFVVYEDGEPQAISHFNNERVPVSLGIALDTSGSMTPDKMGSARSAIDRFMYDLLGRDDEMFLLRFANVPQLVQDWTTDRRVLSRALADLYAGGGTAMYDAVADALPVAAGGKNRKKALLVISDGNDTNSSISVGELRQMIRESEVLVYAIGIDGEARQTYVRPGGGRGGTGGWPIPNPFPIPGRGRPQYPPIGGGTGGGVWTRSSGDRVNADALRSITDDTGGRTEIVRDARDLDGATARVADELSKQYYLGYTSPGTKDGRWHAIKVEVRHNRKLTVRARRGYVAS